MKEFLQTVMAGRDLSRQEMREAFDRIMSGAATPAQIAGLLVALRMKGESVEEIVGGAESMRRHAVFVDPMGLNVVDTCGTGGDGLETFNVSTTAAFVTAGAGVVVAKHGNRAISSRCGSADVLAALGVNIEATPDVVENCLREAGIGFLYAPKLHPAMKHAMPARKELGVRTLFNMLGPLTNPAGARGQVIGVFSPVLTEPFAEALRLLGCRRAFVAHGHDGMDELSVCASSRVSELANDRVRTYEYDPRRLLDGEYASLAELRGGGPDENAAIVRAVLGGERGPRRDIVALNAAAAIAAGGMARDIAEGWALANASLDSGAARARLDALVACSNGA